MADQTTQNTAGAIASGATPGATAPVPNQAETAGATQAGQNGGAPAADGAKKQAAAGSEASKADGAGKAPGADAPLVVKLPDGMQIDKGILDSFTGAAKELGLTGEQAQKLADSYAKAHGAATQKAEADRDATVKGWEDQIRQDKEFGGVKLDASMAAAKRAIAQFGTPELKELFNSTGWGSHPEMFRFAARVGLALAEDSVAGTGGSGETAADKQQQRLLSWYPKQAGAQ